MEEGLVVNTKRPGDATNFPTAGQTVSVHYVCWLDQEGAGKEAPPIDSSRARGKPFLAKIGSNQLIRAWEEVLPKMSVGQVVEVIAPSAWAYGGAGYPPLIPANSTLIYEIELVAFSP